MARSAILKIIISYSLKKDNTQTILDIRSAFEDARCIDRKSSAFQMTLRNG